MVLAAPRIRANRTSTPPSPKPQKELQKSNDRFCKTGEFTRAYLESDVVDDWRLAEFVIEGQWKKKNKGGGLEEDGRTEGRRHLQSLVPFSMPCLIWLGGTAACHLPSTFRPLHFQRSRIFVVLLFLKSTGSIIVVKNACSVSQAVQHFPRRAFQDDFCPTTILRESRVDVMVINWSSFFWWRS